MSPFKIEFSPHAQERLKQRRITRRQVRICLTQGALVGIDIRGRRIKNLDFSGKTLEVIYLDSGKETLIVTSYWKAV